MFNKIKKRNDHRKIFFDREFESFFRFINKYSTRQFAVMAVIVATAVICTFEGFEYIYRQSVITRQTAVILLILIRQFLIQGYSIYSVIIRTVPAMIRKRVIYRLLFRYTMIQVHL